MKRYVLLLFVTIVYSISVVAQTKESQKNMGVIGGSIFDGRGFVKKDFYVVNGIFTMNKPNHVDSVINIKGKFVIPPFVEAHNHNLEKDYKIDDAIRNYLSNGVFYVKMQSSIKKRIDIIKEKFNKPGAIDVSYAHAPLTASGGHPVKLREDHFERGLFKGVFNSKSEIEGHGYFIIDTKDDLKNKWHLIMTQSPDFIKINLLYSEEYKKRKDDRTYFGNKGLDPSLVKEIADKAHANGLRVSSHVESAHDFHVAVTSGVDEINHLPCIDRAERLNIADIELAAKKGTIVVTTVSLVEKYKGQSNYESLLSNIRENLILLKETGIKIAIGSDIFADNSQKEAFLLHQLGIFSNTELIKMWCEVGAQTTFPNRKIGFIKNGYEASFIVLNDNPLERFEAVKNIYLLMKQGMLMSIK